jgi:triosephosphate isomerase
MRKKLIAGNWKMNLSVTEAENLSTELIKSIKEKDLEKADVVVCPPFISLIPVGRIINESGVKLGAQNLHYEDNGAYTGEISAEMLKSAGCNYVILGHSERRKYFAESNSDVNRKIKKALSFGIHPIVCVGESLEERERGSHKEVVEEQLSESMKDLSLEEFNKIVIAYEPVWAIGTGKNATPEQANEMHKHIRDFIKRLTGMDTADSLTILYGGSLNEKNAEELLAEPDIDGGLIGGASLKAESFITIIRAIK